MIINSINEVAEQLGQTVQSLLTPINAENQTGLNLRPSEQSSGQTDAQRQFRQIKNRCKQARRDEQQLAFLEDDNEKSPAQRPPFDKDLWRTTEREIVSLLTEQTKDLELVCALTEAWIRLYGFAGLTSGLTLASQMIQQYGTALHPKFDPQNPAEAQHLQILTGEQNTLIKQLCLLPLIENTEPIWLSSWLCAGMQQLKKEHQNGKNEFGVTRSEIESSVNVKTIKELQDQAQCFFKTLEVCQEFSNQIGQYTSGLFETEGLKEAVLDCQNHFRQLTEHRLKNQMPTQAGNPNNSTNPTAVQASSSPTSSRPHPVTPPNMMNASAIENREQALNRLQEIADFFRETEPHSPMSYAIERTIRWGQMPLNELIKELISDKGAQDKFQALTGVVPSKKETP